MLEHHLAPEIIECSGAARGRERIHVKHPTIAIPPQLQTRRAHHVETAIAAVIDVINGLVVRTTISASERK